MAIELTLEKAIEMVDAVIAEAGADYVYPYAMSTICQYVDYDCYQQYDYSERRECRPGCVVGRAFIKEFDLDIEELSYLDVNTEGSDVFVDWLIDEGYLRNASTEALRYLRLLQRSQDAGRPWGEANENAKRGRAWSTSKDEYIDL